MLGKAGLSMASCSIYIFRSSYLLHVNLNTSCYENLFWWCHELHFLDNKPKCRWVKRWPEQSNFDNDPTPSSSSKSDSGSGDYYDYYDHEDNENEEMRPGDEKLSTQTSMSCINNLHTVDRSRGVVLIDRWVCFCLISNMLLLRYDL